MAISTVAAIAGLGSAALGAQGSKAAGKAQTQGLTAGLNLSAAQFEQARADVAPWKEVGQAALLQLGQALGIEGYRTQEEIKANAFLKTKPTGPAGIEGMPTTAMEKLTRASPSAKALSGTKLEALGGFGAVSQGQAKRKRAKIEAAQTAAAQAKYEADLATWQTEADRLKALSEQSLVGYEAGAAQKAQLQASPDYQFRLAEGEKALARSTAATTGVLQPGAAKELLKYGQDYASQEWGNYINRLAATAGLGQAAAGQQAGFAQNQGVIGANIQGQIGSAKAGAIENTYGSLNQALQGTASNVATQSQYNQLLKNAA
jgi:hypothetical protein